MIQKEKVVDFVLENINRKSKMWMPSGLPDKKKWLEVCRNIDRLDELQDHMYNILNLQPADEDYVYSYDLSEEIFNFRKIIRNSSYFDQKELTTLQGKLLDRELINFTNKSRDHRNDFLSQVVENNLATKKKYEPVFITPADRNEYFDISKRTKPDIVKAVELELEGLDDEKLTKRWMKIKGKNKIDLLTFLKEIEDIKSADNSV
ncbi:unnamed protein product [Mytilus edulis]|uniref:Uncharacterized protein n=1 Tax=Mytilus edulis TaxID=6550 RepID=A0A8S3TQI5_MYTED|nr:unnamed protein product [Mytilus edulis]